jgi:hypothetical protein
MMQYEGLFHLRTFESSEQWYSVMRIDPFRVSWSGEAHDIVRMKFPVDMVQPLLSPDLASTDPGDDSVLRRHAPACVEWPVPSA